MVRRAVLVIQDQGRDGVQGVEQEMGIQLVPQHLQLRFLGQRGGLQCRLPLVLQGFVVLDAEVQSAPAQQQVGRRSRSAEQLENRLERVLRLDEPPVGKVYDGPKGERRDVTRRQDHERRGLRRTSPKAAIDVSHRRRQDEPGYGREYEHGAVAARLFIQQGAEELRYRVSAPAGRVQRPEEHVAVGTQLFERRHAK